MILFMLPPGQLIWSGENIFKYALPCEMSTSFMAYLIDTLFFDQFHLSRVKFKTKLPEDARHFTKQAEVASPVPRTKATKFRDRPRLPVAEEYGPPVAPIRKEVLERLNSEYGTFDLGILA